MDASQYKDYVLVLLFIKYVSDKYAGRPYAPIAIPPGAGFKDMVALKGTIIAPLVNANRLSDFPDFNDATKLGAGKEMVERLTSHRHLREPGPGLLQEPCRRRRHPGRRLRIPHAPLRHRVRRTA